jgi:hypothetical protein
MNAGIRRPSKIQNSYLKDSPTWFQPQSDVTSAHSMPFKRFKWKGKGGAILMSPTLLGRLPMTPEVKPAEKPLNFSGIYPASS